MAFNMDGSEDGAAGGIPGGDSPGKPGNIGGMAAAAAAAAEGRPGMTGAVPLVATLVGGGIPVGGRPPLLMAMAASNGFCANMC